MAKALSIEAVNNGWICRKLISEGEQSRVEDLVVFREEAELLEWVKKNR
jgi:hypothetical protein